MLASTPVVTNTVFVAKPVEMSYADAMLGLRVWLDHEKIQPAGFKLYTGGRIGFEFIFSTERDALAFKGFEWVRH
jgi:outer membrane lipoprotein-sorting protein